MPRVSKRKQHLAKIAPLVVEGNKRRKDIRQIEKYRAFRIRQREEKDFWDEYESDLVRDTSSDESSSDGEEEEEEEDEGCEERQAETSTDNSGLSVFHSGSGDYLRVVRGTGSRERRRIRELEKAASNSQFIKTMFATQNFRTSQNPIPTNKSTVSHFLEEKNSEEVSENTETIRARAVQD